MKTAANRKDKIAGIVCAAAGAVAYGLNPFFGIPLYKEGMLPLSVLFYRLTFGAVLMGGVMLARRQSFVLPKRYIAAVAGNGVLLALSCLFCFLSFRIMSSGISATLQFVYPVMVALIMFAFFRERLRLPAVCGVVLAVSGTALLCTPAEGVNVSALGISYSMLSAFTYYADFSMPIPAMPGNILISDCRFENADRFLHLNFSGNETWQRYRSLDSIEFRNIVATNVKKPITLYGKEGEEANLRLRNVDIQIAQDVALDGLIYACNFKELVLDGVRVEGELLSLVKTWSDGNVSLKGVEAGHTHTVVAAEDTFFSQRI